MNKQTFKTYDYICYRQSAKSKSYLGYYRFIKGNIYQVRKTEREDTVEITGFFQDNEGNETEHFGKFMIISDCKPYLKMTNL